MTSRITFVTPTACLVTALAMLLVTGCPASAQTPAPATASTHVVQLDSPEFARLVKGKKVIVTTLDGKERKGVFEVSATGLVTEGRAEAGRMTVGGQTLPFDQIVKVTAASPHRGLNRGIGVGLASGFGISIATYVASDGESDSTAFVTALAIGVGVGATIGALSDYSGRDKRIIYQAKPRTTTMSFAPILSKTRKGAALSISWR